MCSQLVSRRLASWRLGGCLGIWTSTRTDFYRCKSSTTWNMIRQEIQINSRRLLRYFTNLFPQNEKCIKPFIDICDLDQNSVMNTREWCHCFEKTDRPCAAVRRRLNGDLAGTYAPDCDAQGFYKATQCHSIGVCWCVDKHGVEFANTRTRDKPNCGK